MIPDDADWSRPAAPPAGGAGAGDPPGAPELPVFGSLVGARGSAAAPGEPFWKVPPPEAAPAVPVATTAPPVLPDPRPSGQPPAAGPAASFPPEAPAGPVTTASPGRVPGRIGTLAGLPTAAVIVVVTVAATLGISLPLRGGSSVAASAPLPAPGQGSAAAAVAGFLGALERASTTDALRYVGPPSMRAAVSRFMGPDQSPSAGLEAFGLQVATTADSGTQATVVVTGALCGVPGPLLPPGGFDGIDLCFTNTSRDPGDALRQAFFRYPCVEIGGQWYVDASAWLQAARRAQGEEQSNGVGPTFHGGQSVDRAAQSDLVNALTELVAVYQSRNQTMTGVASQLPQFAPEFQWRAAGAELAGAASDAVGVSFPTSQSAVLADWSGASSTCWFALVVEKAGDRSIARDDLTSPGTFFAASAGSSCRAAGAPTSGWQAELSAVVPVAER